jgi:hypothetical protein
VKIEKPLQMWNIWTENKLIEDYMLHQKALSLQEEFSQETNGHKPFPASKGWLHRFRNWF